MKLWWSELDITCLPVHEKRWYRPCALLASNACRPCQRLLQAEDEEERFEVFRSMLQADPGALSRERARAHVWFDVLTPSLALAFIRIFHWQVISCRWAYKDGSPLNFIRQVEATFLYSSGSLPPLGPVRYTATLRQVRRVSQGIWLQRWLLIRSHHEA